MNKKHAKSPCCGAKTVRFGMRRRQCKQCKKTWRIRKKKRGRKERRDTISILVKFLNHKTATLASMAEARKVSSSTMQERIAKLLDRFLMKTAWPPIPEGPLVMVADARVKYVEGGWFTGHFFFLRSIRGTDASILEPFWRPGTETTAGWRLAFDSLSPDVMGRVVALTCDGHNGLVYEARYRGWLLQRCHAHLIMRIQSRRSRWYSSQHKAEGEEIYRLVKRALTEPNEQALQPILSRIEEMGWQTSSPDLRRTLLGFVTNHQDWRTYLKHLDLNLPTTNNTAESFGSCVNELVHRARGFRSRTALIKWIAALIKNKKTLKCRGAHQPN